MASYYWNEDSFGSNCPKNWEEIASAVNAHLDDYQEICNADDDEMSSHSDRLWEQFCEDDEICGVNAVWEEAEKKDHHDYEMLPIGGSDIASLTVRFPSKAETLEFGQDAGYKAYVVDNNCEIPNHYQLTNFGEHWVRIYDDDGIVFKAYSNQIRIYRSGCMGCIIQLSEGAMYETLSAKGRF